MDEQTIERPPRPDYLLLPVGVQEDVARTYFRRTQGHEAERVIITGGGTLVGPISEAASEARKPGTR